MTPSTQIRTLLAALLASAASLLAVVLIASVGGPQRASAAGVRTMNVVGTPSGAVAIGQQIVYTLTISNPLATALADVSLSQQITPTLTLRGVSFGSGITGCSQGSLPCSGAQVLTNTTALITVTYEVAGSNLVGQPITYTATLSAPTLLQPLRATANAGPIEAQRLYLPQITKPAPDIYAQWVKLAQPAGGAAVNYLYVAPGSTCAGPVFEQGLPETIIAATNSGIYALRPATTAGSLPSWELRSSTTISGSHIINSDLGYFASAFNMGSVLRSTDSGATWSPEALPNSNQRVYWLAASGQRILAAGNRGLFIREGGAWVADPQVTGVIFSVAASGNTAYAVQVGSSKDTLWRSLAGGAAGSWAQVGQLPGSVNFIQTLDVRGGGSPELLVGVVTGGIYQLGPSGLLPFSQGLSLTAYGLWRDSQGRIYAALRESGGLQRFTSVGGAGEVLNTLAGDAPPIAQRLYTVSGRADSPCNILATGSREGNVWLRRIP
ncbi:MAG: hypothetical protein HGA65_19115 [Oscillochloris sp.]|nr:hypothetical protein [Oscillochloris sp.]